MFGYVGTAGAVALGLLADQFVRAPGSRRAIEGFSAGAAGILGWVGAEKLLYKGGSAPIPARYAQGQGTLTQSARFRALNAGHPAGGAPLRNPIMQNTQSY
jgi:hypothetical protein